VADDMTPDEWDGSEWVPLDVLARRHDHKGHSEEMCIRCGWIMGQIPLNCQNDDTPHLFPSQQAKIERLRAEEEIVTNHIMFLIDHSELWDDDGLSIQMPDGWKYHRG